ncbi:putative ribonuclease H-like domain-containing protein [Tanacetum coccineum]
MAALKYRDEHNKVGFLEKPKGSADYHQVLDFLRGSHIRYAITHDPIIYDSLVKQFWSTASLRASEEGPPAILATIDRTPYTITESLVRSQLQLDDDGGVEDLPIADIYLGMDNLGYPTEGKLTFHKNKFSPQWRFLVHTILHCLSTKSGSWDQFGSQLAIALICLTEGRRYNWSSYIFKGMVNNINNPKKFLMFPRFLQMILEIEPRNTKQYHAFKLTSKMFANMRLNFQGDHMPLLGTMLPPAQAAIADPHALLKKPPESAPDLVTSTNVEDETMGGSFQTSPPRSTQAPPEESEYRELQLNATSCVKEVVGKLVKKHAKQDVDPLIKLAKAAASASAVPTGGSHKDDIPPSSSIPTNEFAGGSDVPTDAILAFCDPFQTRENEKEEQASGKEERELQKKRTNIDTAACRITISRTSGGLLKRPGADLEQPSSKKSKSTEAPKFDVPTDSQQPFVEVPSQKATIEDVEVPSNTTSTTQHTDGDPEAEHKMCLKYASDADSTSDDDTPVNLHADKKAAGVGLVLWGDLKVLMDSPEVNDGSDVWKHQQTWKIQSWKLYAYSGVHVLETVGGLVVHMFVDKKYPLSVNLIERMLDHQLEICQDTVGNELTTAVQLIAFLKKQIADSRRPKVHDCPYLDADFLVADSKFMKVAFGVDFKILLFNPLEDDERRGRKNIDVANEDGVLDHSTNNAVQRETKARTILLQSLLEDQCLIFTTRRCLRDNMVGCPSQILERLPPSWSQVAITLKTKGGLDYLSFDDLYNKLRTLEIDVKGGSSYDSRGTSAPTHSAFISAASTNSKIRKMFSIPLLLKVITTQQSLHEDFDQLGKLDLEELDIKWQMAMLSVRINRFEKKAGRKMKFNNKMHTSKYSFIQTEELDKTEELKALLSVDSMLNWSDHEGEDVENGAAQVYGMIVGAEEDATGSATGNATGNATGDVADDVSNVAPEFALMGHFMPPSNNPDLDDTQFTYGSKSNNYSETNSVSNDFVSCDNSDKSSDSETTDFASCVSSVKSSSSKTNEPLASAPTASVPAGSRNRPTSVPAGSRNRLTYVPAGRPFIAGWKNHGIAVTALQHLFLANSKAKYAMGIQEQWWISSIYMENPHKNRDLGIVDSGCSRSMTGNKEKLDDFVKIVGGTVTFGGGDGKITGKGTIRTSKLNFENVYYVEELQNFNLFSVSQICDTKNKVLFTDKECLVLSKEFQPPENSQVVLRVPRRNNLYCFNLSDIKPERDVTCLLAKASLVESTKWHRRMAHVNFKNMNKLAKHGLVNGLPSKLFTNEHNCVACNKGKQHKASYKAITAVSTISEAVSTACYVLNRVLVTKPHNKTPYELVSGKVPNISHLKPFGCLVTILNTSDHLGKFEGKADEGFIVGYAAHSYTRFKTKQPAGTQDTNIHAGTQEDSDSECDEQEILVPSFPSNSFSGPKVHEASDMVESSSDYAEELARLQRQAFEANATAAKQLSQADLAASRNRVPAGSVVPTAGVSDGPTESSTPVFTPVHTAATSLPPGFSLGSSEHSLRYPSPSDLANSMSSSSEMEDIHHHSDTGIFSSSSYDDDFGVRLLANVQDNKGTITQTIDIVCLLVFLSQLETKQCCLWKYLSSETRDGKIAIGTKWILKNKRDARGMVVRNKARLVAQERRALIMMRVSSFMGKLKKSYVLNLWDLKDPHFPKHVYRVVKALYGLHQASRAWDIILVQVYVDDIIFGSTNKAWCDDFEVLMKGEFEMSAMGELTFFSHTVKQMSGVVRPATTPFEASKPNSKNEPDDVVNVHLYRSMIGSLMYLTVSRPDIQFAVSACSRHQVTPLTSNLNAVKKIFKYLKGQLKLGLRYPRDSPFVLEAYSDNDYTGSHGDRKSTTDGC